VLAALLCNIIIAFGCGFYAFSLFVTPAQQQLGWGSNDSAYDSSALGVGESSQPLRRGGVVRNHIPPSP